MPASSKPSTSIRRTKPESDSALLVALSDPSTCDDQLARRLARALNLTQYPATEKGKQRSVQPGDDDEDRRRLAMRAANTASQSLGKVVQSQWKASQKSTATLSMGSVLSIVSSFRTAIGFLREANHGTTIEVDRVASCFLGKLILVQLYEPALELLDEIRVNLIRSYNGRSTLPVSKKTIARSTPKPSFTKYMHLLQYPQPAPQDPILLALVGTSLGQALTAVAALIPLPPANDAVLETFIAGVERDDGPISWHSSLPTDQADTLLARAHRALATTFSSSNTPPHLLLRLRALAFRCLLRRVTLEPDVFWTQVTDCMASHGKSVIKSEDAVKAVNDVMTFFNSIVTVARERRDAATFMSGSVFLKFCEVALIFAKRGDTASLSNITRLINNCSSGERTPDVSEDELSNVKLHAVLSHGAAMLEQCPDDCTDSEVMDSLSQCTGALSRGVNLELTSKAIRSMEHLRRACGKVLESTSARDGLRNAVKFLLVTMVDTMEHCTQRQRIHSASKVEGDFTASIVDSLCRLAKVELLPANAVSHMTSYDFLQRAVTLVNSHALEDSTSKQDGSSALSLAKVLRVLAGAFWNSAVTLYQDNRHAAAIRFLVQACGLTAKVCHMTECVGPSDSDEAPDSNHEQWKVLKSHLPKRWELLGDCYAKIGERRPAHGAFIESLKTHSFDVLCRSASSSSPSQLSSDAIHRRLASLVERITHIAVFDLLMQDDASLRQTLCATGVDRKAIGIILEWQAANLEQNSWKSEVQHVLDRVLRDALDLYGQEFPVRRARVLLRQLELAYRVDDVSIPVNDIVAEVQDLLSQDSGKDAAFIDIRPQYKAVAHIWMAFHAHRRSQNNNQSAIILHHATQASKILRCTFPPAQVSGRVKSPKLPSKVVTTKVAKVATRSSPRKKTTVAVNPVTPKPRKMAMRTPPNPRINEKHSKPSPSKSSGPIAVAGSHLITNIQMIAHLMGLLGHVVLKIQFLNILQRMTERSSGLSANDFVRSSVDAANEYVRLGKIQRAMAIYGHALAAVNCDTAATISDEVRVTLLLHYAASYALNGNVVKSSSLYEEARGLAQSIESQQLHSTVSRIRARVLTLERSALASNVFSTIQIAQDDPHAAFSTLRQSLRLWNRAWDTLSRLCPTSVAISPNPFDMTSLAEALPATSGHSPRDIPQAKKPYRTSTTVGDLQWRIAEGLLHTLFELGRAYFLQGTVRDAAYYIEQARVLAQALNSPILRGRALAKKGELQLHQGKLDEASTSLLEASELLQEASGIDAAEVNRLRAHHNQLSDQDEEAKALYLQIMDTLSELENTLSPIENGAPSPRRSSLTQSPGRSNHREILVPSFLATVLRQQIWLQRNESPVKTKALLDQISTLPPSRETKAEKLAILAKMALHDAHVQFRADLFLNSLTESTIALPMEASSHAIKLSSGAKQMLETLSMAEKMFWDTLGLVSTRGQASDVREAAASLVLILSFQTSLGKGCTTGARVVAGLLDASAAITLRREFVDEIERKFPELAVDDLVWPTIRGKSPVALRGPQSTRSLDSCEDQDLENPGVDLKAYWRSVRDRYYSSYDLDDQSVCISQVELLPAHWTVVSISITEDKSTMFFSRQRHGSEPLIFCVPLQRHGRKDEHAAEQFTYWDAIGQLRKILQESDANAEEAKGVSSQDRDAKVSWWAKRAALDKRMRELLENIEFCWLGAFKTILSEPCVVQPDVLSSLRVRFENVFKRNLTSDKKQMSRVKLDDPLMECFASLSPKCRDEELEDLVYFVLDLYQFHGIHVALSEVDMDHLTVELRMELEEHASKAKHRVVPIDDAHLFLVLDKNVQGLPWESIPVLRGRSVSRIPSLSFLVDRIELAKLQRESAGVRGSPPDRAMVNPKKTFYVLNPSGDLTKSEARFGAWVKEMGTHNVGWKGIVGQVPSEQELLDALSKKDLVIYFGHGGAEQYVRSYKIKQLQRCAATMLWGCSSGLMREMGDFDRIGTPYNYMVAGCPTLVACLWDVTDNELDKISRSVFDKLRLDAEHVKSWSSEMMDEAPMSVVAAVGQSRDACKLKYLTGAAPVVYGIPFYL